MELVGPEDGELGEGEEGVGRMAEPEEIFASIERLLAVADGPLRGKRVLITQAARRSRSTPCATSETARRGAWESPSPRKLERGGPT